MDLVNVIKETRATKAQGSAEGRAKMKKGGAKTKASKSRVKVYDSITNALKKGYEFHFSLQELNSHRSCQWWSFLP